MITFKILAQLIILFLLSRLTYQNIKHSSSTGELIASVLFLMLFWIAGTFEELWMWVKGLL